MAAAWPSLLQDRDRGMSLASSRLNPVWLPDFRKPVGWLQEGLMKARPVVLSLLIAGLMTVGTVASRNQIGYARTVAIVNFVDPVLVTDRVVMGPVLIVHDDEKMAQGEACTRFYRFDPARGPQEEIVSFHCTPVQRPVAEKTRLTLSERTEPTCRRLLEYQIADESEAHAIPPTR